MVAATKPVSASRGIPQDEDFDYEGLDGASGEYQYVEAPNLEEDAEKFIKEKGGLAHLREATIIYLWRRKGGTRKGRQILAMTQKPAGLLKHYSEADLICWFAADHLRDAEDISLRAILYHELCHIERNEDTGIFRLVDHEFEGFLGELEKFGPHTPELRKAKDGFVQLKLVE